MYDWETAVTQDEIDEQSRAAIEYDRRRLSDEYGIDIDDYPDYIADVEREIMRGYPADFVAV
jgi:hypothetical protein